MDIQSPTLMALRLLLALDRQRYLSGTGTSFRQDLTSYTAPLLRNLQSPNRPAAIYSRDSLEALLSSLNLGSLIQHLLGRQDRVYELIRCTVEFVHRVSEQARMQEWHAFAVQPCINLARAYRAVGDTSRCLALLDATYSIVVNQKGGFLCNVPISDGTGHLMQSFYTDPVRLVEDNCQVEDLKCALIDKDLELVRERWDAEQVVGPSRLHAFKLECILKAELSVGNFERIVRLVSDDHAEDLWCLMYSIDALMDAQQIRDARELAILLAREWSNGKRYVSLPVGYSLAVRLACLGEVTIACSTAEKLMAVSASTRDEVMKLRVATLLVVISNGSNSKGRHAWNEKLWSLLCKSRHNYERLANYVSVSLALEGDHPGRYFNGARYLRENVALPFIAVEPAVEALARQTSTCQQVHLRKWACSENTECMDTSCPPAEQLFHQLVEISRHTPVQFA
jgi:hypothetical protein